MATPVTKTELANKALSLLGEKTILNNVEETEDASAKVLRLHLTTAFQSALVAYDWSFATGVTDEPMTVLRECPSTGYMFAYDPPKDYLRIRTVGVKGSFKNLVDRRPEELEPFREITRRGLVEIHTDLPEAYCEFTENVTIEGSYPPSFTRIAAAYLAMDAGPGIITDNYAKVKRVLESNIKQWINQAIAEDQLTRSQKIRPVSSFITARSGDWYYPSYDSEYARY